LETAGNIEKTSKIQPGELLEGVLQGVIIGLKLYRKKMFQIGRYFQGSKNDFRQQVWGLGFHTAIL